MSSDSPETDEPRVEPVRFRFRIVHLLYATALIASTLATFGAGGAYVAIVLLAGWTYVFLSKSRPQALILVVTIGVFGECCLCLPVGHPHNAARRMHCSNNLKQIALALHNYHDTYKTFPPAMIPDSEGKPMHSWRVLILPFLEQQPLYASYDFNEPWNGPNNSQLANPMPSVYLCPSHRRSNCASYAAVIGDHTIWAKDGRGVQFQDIIDGTSNTILVLEAEPRQSNWMEPSDITYEEALELLSSRHPKDLKLGHRYEDFFYERWTGRNTALADGSARFLPLALPRGVASAMLLRDDSAKVDLVALNLDDLSTVFHPVARLRLDNCFRLALFTIVALFPFPWVCASRNLLSQNLGSASSLHNFGVGQKK